MTTIFTQLTTPMQQTRVDVFEGIFLLFLGLGTLIGIIVISYTLYNAYKYRDDGKHDEEEDLPVVGELPTGGKGGRKLFVSFGLSAIIVLGLVFWSYQMLLYVEAGPDDGSPGEDALEVDVEGQAFSWTFHYENGVESGGELVVPADRPIWVTVTSTDVWHAFGIPEYRVKTDAIPGEEDTTWFIADAPEDGESETYEGAIECFELCGAGHSNMKADLTVMDEEAYEEWMAEQEAEMESEGDNESDGNESADGDDDAGNETANESGTSDDETNANETGDETDANGTDEGDNASEDNETGTDEGDETGEEGED